ncbi:DUF397 domain-containing protein [Nonomuraea sp. NPDC002799]
MANQPALGTSLNWQTSSFCNNGNCVEVALSSADTVVLRDNKNMDGPILRFTTSEWRDFLIRVAQSR